MSLDRILWVGCAFVMWASSILAVVDRFIDGGRYPVGYFTLLYVGAMYATSRAMERER